MRINTLRILTLPFFAVLMWSQVGQAQSVCAATFEPHQKDYLDIFMDSVESPVGAQTDSPSSQNSGQPNSGLGAVINTGAAVSREKIDLSGLAILGRSEEELSALRKKAQYLLVRDEFKTFTSGAMVHKSTRGDLGGWIRTHVEPLLNWTPPSEGFSTKEDDLERPLTPYEVALMTLLISAHDSNIWETAVIRVNSLRHDQFTSNEDWGNDWDDGLLATATRSRDLFAGLIGTEIPENWRELQLRSGFVQNSERALRTQLSTRPAPIRVQALKWSQLNDRLSDAEIQLFLQILSWDVPTRSLSDTLRELRTGGPAWIELTGVRPGENGPLTAATSWELLFQTFLLELATRDLRPETFAQLERFLSVEWNEDEALIYGSSEQWRPMLEWIQSNRQQAYQLMRDALEFRSINPEVR